MEVDAVDARPLAKWNIVSSAHSAEANVSVTPLAPWQEAEFISATRNGRLWRWATAMNGDIGVARPAEELSASRLGIDGKPGLVGSVTHARSG